MLKHLSPSSLALWEKNKDEFYLRYMTDAPKTPSTEPYLIVGSAFDAYVKAALFEACFGKIDPAYEFDAIFTSQVVPEGRDFGLKAGKYIFDCYKQSGSYAELLTELQESREPPRFEFTADGTIWGVPLTGKPDCKYVHKGGASVILDWKVTGFCSNYGSSPYKGFKLVRDSWSERETKHSRVHDKAHKDYAPRDHLGLEISSTYLEDTCPDWADQLAIYSWTLGEEVGAENTVMRIDQICSKARKDAYPLLRVANHVALISKDWQQRLLKRLIACWNTVTSGEIENSDVLDEVAKSYMTTDDMKLWVHSIKAKKTFSTRDRG